MIEDYISCLDVESDIAVVEVYPDTCVGGTRPKSKVDKWRKQEKRLDQVDGRMIRATEEWKMIFRKWKDPIDSKKIRSLVWKCVPPSIRGQYWMKIVANDLSITPELFHILRQMDPPSSKGGLLGRAVSVSVIASDLPRTFPALSFFQPGAPLYESLKECLEAYVNYRPDVGYVQGMSYLVAMLLLNLDTVSSFICLANILNRRLYRVLYSVDMTNIEVYMVVMDALLEEFIPAVHKHFHKMQLEPIMYCMVWFLSLYSQPLPLDVASRVWDLYLLEGEPIIFRTALALVKMHKTTLLQGDFAECARILTNLSNTIEWDELSPNIAAISLSHRHLDALIESSVSMFCRHLPHIAVRGSMLSPNIPT